jgi:hypothetical protein
MERGVNKIKVKHAKTKAKTWKTGKKVRNPVRSKTKIPNPKRFKSKRGEKRKPIW